MSGATLPPALRIAAVFAITLAAFAAPGAAAGIEAELPYGESVAYPQGASPLRFNPASIGVVYPHEIALSYIDQENDAAQVAGSFEHGGFRMLLRGNEDVPLSFGFGLAGGAEAFRQGLQASWIPRTDGGHAADWRYGALSRPTPWLSIGGVADHLGQPSLGSTRLDRAYDIGVGLRPFALSRPSAHTLGTRLTLTSDVRWIESERPSSAVVDLGAEAEILHGIRLRGSYDTDTRGFRLGFSVAGVRSRLEGISSYDRDQNRQGSVWTLSSHDAENRTVLASPAERRVAVVRMRGALSDESLTGFSIFGTTRTISTASIHRQLERALEDPLTRGVLIDASGLGNMAQLEELRARIQRLRAAGKPVVAYLEYGARRNGLYLASACDRIVTTPEALYQELGLRAERRYYRKALAGLGLRIDRTSYGSFKSAFREYSVDSTTGADRESMDHLLDTHQELFVSAVATGRGMDRARLMPLLDGRLWRAEDLRAAGLVDSIGYRKDALALVGTLAGLGKKPHTVSLARREPARVEWTVPGRVAVVYASGAIESGGSGNDLLLGPFMGSETMSRQIERAFRNRDVRAVVLRIESGGGSGLASDLIRQSIARAKQETGKPLVVSMGQSAASGGYLIALPGDRLFANRFTHTGSIGVLYVRPSLEGFYRKHDIRQDDFVRGEYMRALSMGHDWTGAEQALADSITRREYRLFVQEVATARHLDEDDAERAAQGRVWMGDDAVKLRLVDQIGDLEAAIADARVRGKVPAGEKIRVVEYRRPQGSWFQRVSGSLVLDALERSFRTPDPGQPMQWDGGVVVEE